MMENGIFRRLGYLRQHHSVMVYSSFQRYPKENCGIREDRSMIRLLPFSLESRIVPSAMVCIQSYNARHVSEKFPTVPLSLISLQWRKSLFDSILGDDEHLKTVADLNMSFRGAGEGVFDQTDDDVFGEGFSRSLLQIKAVP